jgi:hypothetical protein
MKCWGMHIIISQAKRRRFVVTKQMPRNMRVAAT